MKHLINRSGIVQYKNPMRIPSDRGYAPISAKLFYNCSLVAFMPDRVVFKDERPTSNFQRRTSNNDVAPLCNLISFVLLFLFLHLFPFNVRCWTFDVRCSIVFSKPSTVPRRKNNLALMGLNPYKASAAGSPPKGQTGTAGAWPGFVNWCPAGHL